MADNISTVDSETWSQRFNAYGALGVTACIFGMFFFGMAVTAWQQDGQSFNNMLETVKSLVMIGGGYWLGSSNEGRKKTDVIAAQSAALATSVPSNAMTAVTTTTKTDSQGAVTTTEPTSVVTSTSTNPDYH